MHQPDTGFPIVSRPNRAPLPVVVSIPHFGTESLPGITIEDFADSAFVTFPWGYSDLFVGDVYADAASSGALVVTTPYSRLFVDVNRRRGDFETLEGEVKSQRGVFRTHMINDQPIFAAPLSPQTAETRLRRYYDPYHQTLRSLIDETLERFGRVLLLDAHTGSPNGMGEHEVVIGTRHGKTAAPELVDLTRSIFEACDFRVDENVSGYAGGHIVHRYTKPEHPGIHALQIEINSGLLMTTPRKELIARMMKGQIPGADQDNVGRARVGVARSISELAAALPRCL